MDNKTAMQEFIDNVIPMHVIELPMIKNAIEKALEKEKEQMFEYVKHSYIIENKELQIHKELFEQWYNQNYKNGK